jgi:hypothetical protein
MDKHIMTEENAERAWKWIKERQGIAIWKSLDLSDPSKSWSSPVLNPQGNPTNKPSWQSDSKPSRIINDPAEVMISIPKEYKRFRVAVRRGAQGLTLKLTDTSSHKLENAVSRAHEETGKPSWYQFDYGTQEAVIMIDDTLTPLNEYAREKGWK